MEDLIVRVGVTIACTIRAILPPATIRAGVKGTRVTWARALTPRPGSSPATSSRTILRLGLNAEPAIGSARKGAVWGGPVKSRHPPVFAVAPGPVANRTPIQHAGFALGLGLAHLAGTDAWAAVCGSAASEGANRNSNCAVTAPAEP